MLAKGRIDEAKRETTLGNIETFTDLASGIQDAFLAVEAATENVELKLRIFKEMDEKDVIDEIIEE